MYVDVCVCVIVEIGWEVQIMQTMFKRCHRGVSSHSEKRRSHGETAMNCLAWPGVDAGNCQIHELLERGLKE